METKILEGKLLDIALFDTMIAADDKIVVEKYELTVGEVKTASGIVIPGTKRRKSMVGFVISLGRDYTGSVKKGNYVIYNEFTGAPVEFGDKILIGLEPNQIFAILMPKRG